MACLRLWQNLTRRKQLEDWLIDSPLRRCLTFFDLTSLGTGALLGAGLYVVVGELAREIAGPAIVLSFLLASFAALLSVFFYAELGCRIPKEGSAYVYTYVTLGEIWAFILGWTLVLEYILVGACLARTCSEYINTIFQEEIYRFFMHDIATWNQAGIAQFPDFLAAAIVGAVTILMCFGIRLILNVQKAMTIGNILVICYIVIYGLCFVDVNNWTRNFAPYGVKGVLRGAAIVSFALVGFDVIASAAEEAVDPERNVPLSSVITITICAIAYFGVTAVLTLVVPYEYLASVAPMAEAFSHVGSFPAAEYIIAFGGICATISALVSVLFSSSRILHAMSLDGLLFTWLSHVNGKTHSPTRATIYAGVISAALAVVFDIKQMVEVLSIGILLAYAVVAICVLVSRYQPGVQRVDEHGVSERKAITRKWLENIGVNADSYDENFQVFKETHQSATYRERKLADDDKAPKHKTEQMWASCIKLSVFSLVVGIIGLVVVLSVAFQYVLKPDWWAIFLLCMFGGTIIVSLVALQLQPQNKDTFSFMVPGVPYIPALSIFIDVLLMANLQWMTFARFGIWMAIGFIIYFLYGYQHSMEAVRPADLKEGEFVLHDVPDYETIADRPQVH